jgi:hypothetical protein
MKRIPKKIITFPWQFFSFSRRETVQGALQYPGESGWLFILKDEYRASEPFHDINYPFRLF